MQGHAERSCSELLCVRGCRSFSLLTPGLAWAWGSVLINIDFGLVTVLQGQVPKAITDLA